ncbi:MAG TPA: SRPBCC family protein [Acidimicrobiales bacterium]|nr:SRPBCC family protein [Acidimicrobiales bacterium]
MPATTVEVGRAPEEVFAYVTDPGRFTEWQHGVVSGHLDDDLPPGPGTRCVTVRKVGFGQRPVTSEITHVDPPRTWGVRGIDGPIRATVNVTVEPVDGGRGAKVSVDVDFTGHGIGKLLVPLVVRPQARREMPENLQRLKHRLERGPT